MDSGAMHHGSGMNQNRSMTVGPADKEYDLRFIDSMLLHHEGAVNMARTAIKNSRRGEIQNLAKAIIAAQEQEIEQMKRWRAAWYPEAGNTPIAWNAKMNHSMPMTDEYKQSMKMDMNLGKTDSDFDLRFINAMILHHEGALMMARDGTTKSSRPEIKQLSRDIITSQQKEIDEMRQWRKDRYEQ
jgi:uncharacterized protein (DUF305 family)